MVNIRLTATTMLATLWLSGVWGGSCTADTLLNSDRFFLKLTAPMTLVIDGMPFRDTIDQVASQGKINVWIDRRIDPSAKIRPGQLGPTVYEALKRIAAQRDCVVMPVANVVLIGRPVWVDATTTSLLAIPISSTQQTLQWDDLTTPTEAIKVIAPHTQLRLPHDLWPRANLIGVQPVVGANLIFAQFDRKLSAPKLNDSLQSVPATVTETAQRKYGATEELQAILQDVDPKVKTRVTKDAIFITATATDHRVITDAWLAAVAKAVNQDQNNQEFDLKFDDVVAGAALQQFAQTAGLKCRINAAAMEKCRTRVSIDVKAKKLREIMDLIAAQAGVVITSGGQGIVVSLPTDIEQ